MNERVDYQILQTSSRQSQQTKAIEYSSIQCTQDICLSVINADRANRLIPSISIDILVGTAIGSLIALLSLIVYCVRRRKRKLREDNNDEENRPLLGDPSKKMHFVRRTSTYYQWNRSPPPPPTTNTTTSFYESDKLQQQEQRQQQQHILGGQYSGHFCTEGSLLDQEQSSIPISQSPTDDEDDLRRKKDWEERRKALLKKYARNDQDEAISVNSKGSNENSNES
ncbi:hypothetical protein BDF20DRAFT_113313 [Mycotypha africana]|uniref:uncharacterized protein n=1 Tax=Mycotypha africana TaxID=64632 RepID=UPI0022FFE184|nr:uncharacterized protein BDF20DRAFT_113313 [Mycotypha africana]KAI8970238.1 hypothetical protein BDF20DRAFT_113313 [Mycotypha africana]